MIAQNYNEKRVTVPLNTSYIDLEIGKAVSGTLELPGYGAAFLIKNSPV